MLIYGERIGAAVRHVVPRGDGTPDDDYPTRVQRAVFGYVRGQLLFSTIMGASAGIVLWILGSLGMFPDGKTYAVVFGLWYGFAELIPYIGPAIGAAPPVLLALVSGHPLDALWLTLAFIALQQIEGHIVAPTVFSQALRINPLLVIFALLIGGRLYGFAGAFIALPIAAVLRETVVYLRRHLVLEPWGTPAAGALAGAGTGVAARPDRESGAARRALPGMRGRTARRRRVLPELRRGAGRGGRRGRGRGSLVTRVIPGSKLDRVFPATRMRRLRRSGLVRGMVRETELTPAHLVSPMFVVEGATGRDADRLPPGCRPPLGRRCASRRPAPSRRSASRPCCCSASRRRRTTRARARGTTRASCSSPRGRSRRPIPTCSSSPTSACASTRRTATAASCARTAWWTTTRRSTCSPAPPSPRPRRAPTPSRRAT